jgi:hypothetical protein
MGSPIGSQPVSVAAGDDEVLAFNWSPPNPADYASFGADAGHFCLLSRVETGPAPDFGMTFPETGNLSANVRNNNNIVWKNITIVDEVAEGGRKSAAVIANFDVEPYDAHLIFTVPEDDGPTIFDWGQVWLHPTEQMLELLHASGAEFEGIEQIDDFTYLLAEPGARIGPVRLRPGDIAALGVRLVPTGKWNGGVRILALDVQQRAEDREIGGQRFIVKTRRDPRGIEIDRDAVNFDPVGWLPRRGGWRSVLVPSELMLNRRGGALG